MKYIRYFLVDPKTGKTIHPTNRAPNGRTHPTLDGLDVKTFLPDTENYDMFVATCSDGQVIDPSTGIIEMTESEAVDFIQQGFIKMQEKLIFEAYAFAKLKREEFISIWYHHTEISMGVSSKKEEAEAADAAADDAAAEVVAPGLAIEAGFRGIGIKELASRVLLEYENMKLVEAKYAGVRGNKVDALNSTIFDNTSFNSALSSIESLLSVDIYNGWE